MEQSLPLGKESPGGIREPSPNLIQQPCPIAKGCKHLGPFTAALSLLCPVFPVASPATPLHLSSPLGLHLKLVIYRWKDEVIHPQLPAQTEPVHLPRPRVPLLSSQTAEDRAFKGPRECSVSPF